MGIAGLALATPAQAFRFEYGEIFGDLKTRVSFGASWRVEDRNPALIDKNNLDPTLCGSGVDDACISFNENPALNQKMIDAPGAFFGLNKDDGNLNYDQGDVVAAVSKISSELSLTWGEWVFKAGGTLFYDPINDDFDEFHPDTTYQPQRTPRNDAVRGSVGHDFQIGNLLVSTAFEALDRDFVATIGYQTIRWGESTLIAINSLSEINAPDARFLYQPGTQIAAVFQTTPAAVLSTTLGDSLAVDLIYLLGWRGVEVPEGGAFFAPFDVIGRDYATVSLGQFHEDPNGLQRLPGIGAEISDTSLTVPVSQTEGEPRDAGQFGVKLTWYAADISTEFGFYALNYHSRLPYLSMYATDATCIQDTTTDVLQATADCDGMRLTPSGLEPTPIDSARIFLDYPEDIQLYGVSFNTTIGKWSLAGEVAYRPNLPVQVQITDVVFTALQPALPENEIVLGLGTVGDLTLPGLISIGLDPTTALGVLTSPRTLSLLTQLIANPENDFALPPRAVAVPSYLMAYRGWDRIEPNQLITGYERLNAVQMDFTGIRVLGNSENPIGAEQVQIIAETGFTWITDMPSRDVLQFEGGDYNNTHASPGADGSGDVGDPGVKPTQRLNPTQQTEGFADDFAAGYRLILRLEYNNVIFGWNFKPQILWSHDVYGVAPSPNQNFIEGTMLWQVGTDIEITQKLGAQLFYQGWADGGTVNGYRDKDFAGFAVSYTF
ncbi:DUF1302 domain-containing protein [Sinimarinibacterium thermocellulolyticum]|uniref:DUF1302 family protein n=1 Tax=Sinimarinibacterium thermocellulolyticum TaxID=3170016 RepID=A0ABV2A945_9GAMM